MSNAILGARYIRRNMTFSAFLWVECGEGPITESFNVILQFVLSDRGHKCKWFWGPGPSCESVNRPLGTTAQGQMVLYLSWGQ